jgi:hypothetical protein
LPYLQRGKAGTRSQASPLMPERADGRSGFFAHREALFGRLAISSTTHRLSARLLGKVVRRRFARYTLPRISQMSSCTLACDSRYTAEK